MILKNIINTVFGTSSKNDIKIVSDERHKVAGTSYRQQEIAGLGKKNPAYGMTKKQLVSAKNFNRVYEYIFPQKDALLVKEPDNEHDPKAIKVVIDGIHVGYIKKGSTGRLHNLIDSDMITSVKAIISGGNSKQVDDCGSGIYELETNKREFSIDLIVSVKEA